MTPGPHLHPQYAMPLQHQPRAVFIGLGRHGPSRTERHILHADWAVHVYRYYGSVTAHGTTHPIRPGHVSLFPPGTETVYHFPDRSEHLCAHFHFPEAGPLTPGVLVPAMQDLAGRFLGINSALEDASRAFAIHPLRACVRLWDVLWQLSEPLPGSGAVTVNAHPPCVVRARELIELHLNEPLSVPALAAAVNVSHNHLTRQFRRSLGLTVIAYIRSRRVERARHLLTNTTLPIRTIAEQVGIDDPRLLSRVIRSALGRTPTELRRDGLVAVSRTPVRTAASVPRSPL
ncbi:AraC family transcriptional regulator [Deinococcus irradiatisoli]|uniref:AraC family transcriptional regulator n=1 Tax=Deinococcus irradiatisoli TaxID=2202254 RepID=A0A2Z3JER2_9DEIO|nr:helix-turn-helix domain-containing protein [Deinococcus irradiatisoli]AWN21971.1 AraC family transcriptional regulator [Deinococcus irradiatisoli]